MHWRNDGDTHFASLRPDSGAIARISPWWLAEGRNVYVPEVLVDYGWWVLEDRDSVEEAKEAVEAFLGVHHA